MKIGDKITDGSATFVVRSKKGGGVQNIDGVRPDDTGNISMWDTLHRYGQNYKPSDTSNNGWNSLGLCSIYYDIENTIDNQPSTFGQLINIPATLGDVSTQLWVEQDIGRIYYRGGNWRMPINDTPFKAVANIDEVISVTDKVNDLSSKFNDSLERLKGNHTPVVTDIFDREGTIDLSNMRDSDKDSAKANINKARNSIQNIWNDSCGIYAYGGGLGMQNSYPGGTIKLTQSYKDFDKILIKACNDDGNALVYKMWDVWELAFAFANSYRFCIFGWSSLYWFIYGDTYQGTYKDYTLSTDTIWCCNDENSGIVGIYGIKY